jgi:hypothetical protein
LVVDGRRLGLPQVLREGNVDVVRGGRAGRLRAQSLLRRVILALVVTVGLGSGIIAGIAINIVLRVDAMFEHACAGKDEGALVGLPLVGAHHQRGLWTVLPLSTISTRSLYKTVENSRDSY